MTRSIHLLVAAAILAPHTVVAQNALQRTEALASHAHADSARAVLQLWWETSWTDASRAERQHALWLRGRLTVDPFIAEVDYQRLVEEFPGGRYSDKALSRLGLIAVSAEDPLGAAGYFEALVSEYPTSDLRGSAREWLRENDDDVRRARRLADADREAAGRTDHRPDPGTASESDARLGAPEEGPVAGSQPDGEFAVQLGAFSDMERAISLADRLRDAGYEARLVRVPTNVLVRVRVGYFGDRDDAVRMMLEVREAGFEATLVSDATQEDEAR